MPVFRVNKTEDYTVMSNFHFREKEMSLKAKGLLSLMLSLPDDWDFSVRGLSALSRDGVDSVMNTIHELEKFGYVRVTKSLTNNRFNGFLYEIFECPIDSDVTDFSCTENPYTENQDTGNTDTGKSYTENPTQLSTKGLSTKGSSTKGSSTKGSSTDKNNPPISPHFSSEVEEAFEEFRSFRKEIRKPITSHAERLLRKKLSEIGHTDTEMIGILNQSIERGYQGIFPLKNDRRVEDRISIVDTW